MLIGDRRDDLFKAGRRKMTEKKKLKRGDVSELTVSWSVPARFLNSLLSVFSRIWLYFTPASLMCPLKTSVDGRSCLLMVASEVASLTWWRRAEEKRLMGKVAAGWQALMKRGDFFPLQEA